MRVTTELNETSCRVKMDARVSDRKQGARLMLERCHRHLFVSICLCGCCLSRESRRGRLTRWRGLTRSVTGLHSASQMPQYKLHFVISISLRECVAIF